MTDKDLGSGQTLSDLPLALHTVSLSESCLTLFLMFKTSDFAVLHPFWVLELLMLQLRKAGGGGAGLSVPPKADPVN